MKPILQFQLTGAPRLHGKLLALLAGCLAASLTVIDAAQPSLQPLLGGKWPAFPRGNARDVKVVGNYAYLADGGAGLQGIDVSNPAHCVRVGGISSGGSSQGVAVSGNYAYLEDYEAGFR